MSRVGSRRTTYSITGSEAVACLYLLIQREASERAFTPANMKFIRVQFSTGIVSFPDGRLEDWVVNRRVISRVKNVLRLARENNNSKLLLLLFPRGYLNIHPREVEETKSANFVKNLIRFHLGIIYTWYANLSLNWILQSSSDIKRPRKVL